MTTQPQPKQSDIDSAARDLYVAHRLCSNCFKPVTLADQLSFACPHCKAVILPGPGITPERGREMLATLQARRHELGLGAPIACQQAQTAHKRVLASAQ